MTNHCKYILVGDENADNLRLSLILKQAFGKEHVARFLELHALEPYLANHPGEPIVVCLDLFSYDPTEVTTLVGQVRTDHPHVVFNLYVDQQEFEDRQHQLAPLWQERFRHYYKTYKERPDVEFEPIVRGSLRPSVLEAIYNITHEPVRITPVFARGLVEPSTETNDADRARPVFISYSRQDWDGFVADLVNDLSRRKQPVWVDQNYIVGGDDWMDAIGEALQTCVALVLVLSPEAVQSRYVKMEYRYFFRQNKPIIPVLCRPVSQVPFELSALHYIDFTQGDRAKSSTTLAGVLSQRLGSTS